MTSPEAGTVEAQENTVNPAVSGEFDPDATGTPSGRTYVAVTAELKRLVELSRGQLAEAVADLCDEMDGYFLPKNVGALPAAWIDRIEVMGTRDLESDPPIEVPWVAITVVTVLPGMTLADATELAIGYESELFPYYEVHILTPDEIRKFQEQS